MRPWESLRPAAGREGGRGRSRPGVPGVAFWKGNHHARIAGVRNIVKDPPPRVTYESLCQGLEGVLPAELMRPARRSTPDAADCDDQELTSRVPDDEGHASRRGRMGRGLSPGRPGRGRGAAARPDGPADRRPPRAHGRAGPG